MLIRLLSVHFFNFIFHLPLQIHFSSFANTNMFDIDDAPKVRVLKCRSYPPHMLPHTHFNAENDGRKLKEALEGSGTNEQCIIDIVTTRSNSQRQEIAAWYDNTFDRNLNDDLNDKLSGKFRDIIMGLMTPINEYLCKELHKSLSGLSTDEDALIEILCTKTNIEMAQLIVAYDDC